ncbi:pyridoxamine 5'-phosphate oxidase family protein [Pelotomaculum schinkii]|nr:pyridoxamine 5'-phosphate oxidase family protein [Pelotomaculum schinkii]
MRIIRSILQQLMAPSRKVRPFGFFMCYENKLYFGAGKHKKSYQQILANPYVEISTTSAKGEWIRINGKAVVDDRENALEKAFETLPRLKEIYNEKTGYKMGLFYLEEATAEIADTTGGFKKITLS